MQRARPSLEKDAKTGFSGCLSALFEVYSLIYNTFAKRFKHKNVKMWIKTETFCELLLDLGIYVEGTHKKLKLRHFTVFF